MRDTIDRPLTYCFADEEDRALARQSSHSLSPFLKSGGGINAHFEGDNINVEVTLPAGALRQFVDILTNMAMGRAVSILPVNAELTTQQAADLINVSRPFLVKMLREGTIPFHKVGTHRRVYLHDLLSYKRNVDSAREDVLDELTRQAQELNMDY
jgi:excisionase family DNA binding protein